MFRRVLWKKKKIEDKKKAITATLPEKIWCIIREHIRNSSTFIEAKDVVDWKIIVPKWQRFWSELKPTSEAEWGAKKNTDF